MLDQVVDGTRFLAGVLPTGTTQASLFFSVPAARPRACLAAPRDALTGPVSRVPWIGRQMVRAMAGLGLTRAPARVPAPPGSPGSPAAS